MSSLKISTLGVIAQLLALSNVCFGYPTLLKNLEARQIEEVGESYDYVVVGGGQSGLVIASRLSEDPSKTVLVVEYGYFDNDPAQIEPSSAGNWKAQNLSNLTSEPQTSLSGTRGTVYAASVVGGGSTINGMFFNRGSPDDYNNFEKLGNPGWAWDDLLPYFKKFSTFHPPEDEVAKEFNITWDLEAYGEGPIHHSYPSYQYPGTKIQWDAMVEAGAVPQQEGSLNAYGVFWIPAAIDPSTVTRSYAVSGYYDPIKDRTNLEIVTGTRVNEVLLDENKRANGVTVQPRGSTDSEEVKTVKANTEIILCAGWLHTPQILQRSGIGPAPLLEIAGVEVLVDLPGVGSNLQDHAAASANFRCPMSQTVGNSAGLLPLPVVTPDWEAIITQVQGQNITEYLPATYTEDLVKGYQAQQELLLASFASPEAAVLELPFSGRGGASLVIMKPLSRGTVLMNTTNVYAEPIVDYHALVNPGDALVAANNYRFARKWMSTESAQLLGPEEVSPGANFTTDEELIAIAREGITPTTAHGCCTSPMQPRELGGVVAPDLTVYGVTGLSVGDLSIVPLLISAHPCTTVYAIAEKAADLIIARNAENDGDAEDE
ncbi:hypothetical protein AJ79_06014 [Helicocarpus griseus UAMH5409]|uniref:Glucose-methanol-choline oxidoreductase N-terminal domain-containing protein n=1 Tax=Helicocarpus griseus UAMH5409 TaxID=1447875 RepID=A0A2B7XI60_9EURO|nr:hypothetical protein AJ79_06014 [Helicocarpus griseus UAMH5409]